MKKLIVALFASATALLASAKVRTTDFEDDSLGLFSGSEGGVITKYTTSSAAHFPYPCGGAGRYYCEIDADNASFASSNTLGEAFCYFDMNVQFTTRADGGSASIDNAKIAVFLKEAGKIVVIAGTSAEDKTSKSYEFDTDLNPGDWARLTICTAEGGFKVYVNGIKLGDKEQAFPSLDGKLDATQVAFDGKGALDNFVARTTDPFIADEDIAATIGGEGYASLADALADDNGAPQLEANASYTIDSRGGSVGVKLNNHTLTVTAPTGLYAYPTTSGDVTTYTADYFPRTATAGQDGTAASPFEVADVDDLQALSAAVAADAATFAGKCYVQTADIDMASAGAFAGIGTYAKVPTSGKPFTGTYNGQGYTIANVTRAGGNTQGIFNQVGVGGVIENLVVSNMVFDAEVTGEYGFAIVGNAGGGATLRNLTAAGVFGAADKASTHNMAGIVVRVCGGATAGVTTTIDSCTNNATIYGGYTKLGGICAIVQQQTGFTAGGVAFNNCANNGNLICTRTKAEADKSAVTGNAGIIGYTSASNVVLTACSGMGTITNTNGANTDKDAALIGYQYGSYPIVDNGGNSAPAGTKMIATYGNATKVTGFQYATVDNGVATTVTGALAKDTVYLLERNVAASETPVFTLEEAGDTFKVDTALGYTFAGTVAVDTSTLVPADPVTEGTVTTYAATAGVAAVDDIAYATFADAVDALDGATDDYVTLLADMQTMYTLDSEGTQKTLKVKTNNHCCLVNVGAEDVLVYQAVGGVATYVSKHGVATFNNTNYLSLLSAIEAAAAAAGEDKTVTLLADVTLDDRILITKSVTIDLAGYSITRTAAPNKDNGSAFRVDGDCTVMIKGGTIDCSGVDDSTVLDDGVFAIDAKNGASLTLTNLTVTVNSKNGACVYPWAGSSVTILDGTYANTTQEFYGWERFKNVQKGMAVNQANKDKTGNVAQQLITIYGGSFKQLNPALGDDSWSDGEGTFLASGYVATWNPSTGYYDVAEKTGIDAGESQAVVVDPTGKTEEQQKAEAEAAVELAVTIPGDVSTEIEKAGKTLDQPTYQDYFKKVATPGTGADEGKWVVTAELDETKVFTATESEEAATEQSILAAALGEESTAATVRAAKPGLYYSMEASNDIGFAAGKGTLEGDRTLATGTTVDIEKPNTPSGNAVFFRVKVSRTDK